MNRAIVVAVACAAPALAQPSEFLLIPWGAGNPPTPGSGSIGMYSPQDGTYLGDIVPPDPTRIIFPNCAIIGPDRLIYLSDSVNDAVYRYDLHGNFVDEFLGPDDGLDNVRGLHFLDGDLLVANNPIIGTMVDEENVAVLRFAPDGAEKTPLIPPGSGISAWDIHPSYGGDLIIGDVEALPPPAPVARYTAGGTHVTDIYSASFPTQITDGHEPGTYYGFQFSGLVTIFTDNVSLGTLSLTGLQNAGQGCFALRDGNILGVSFNAGVFVHSADTGARLGTIRTGFGLYGTVSLAQVCWADLTNDGTLDFLDVLAFVVAFAAGEPEADYAAPAGVFDFIDVLVFLDRFAQECP